MVGITLDTCDSKIDRNHTPLCKSKLELAEQSTYAVVCCPLLICSSICLYLPSDLFHVRIKEFSSCARARVCVDGRGSPPGQTDSRRNSENFFEVGVVFLVLNLFC